MDIYLNNIKYVESGASDAQAIELSLKSDNELYSYLERIYRDTRRFNLATRNSANAVVVDLSKPSNWINYVPQKTNLNDDNLRRQSEFEFYVFDDEEVNLLDGQELVVDGQFFRCVPASGGPKNIEDYQYYIMQNGIKKKIPNYKTLEVMLVERGKSLLDVRVLEQSQCNEIPEGSSTSNKSNLWKPEYADITNLEVLNELENNAASAEATAAAAVANAQEQINAVKEEAKAAQEEAKAARAAAEAAKQEAAAREAEASAREAEAAAKEAEFNAQLNSGA